jgi:hypothetical protein
MKDPIREQLIEIIYNSHSTSYENFEEENRISVNTDFLIDTILEMFRVEERE